MKYEVEVHYSQGHEGGDIVAGEENTPWPNHTPVIYTTGIESVNLIGSEYPLGGERVAVNFDPKKYVGKQVSLVVVKYQSGDTFGTSHGNVHFEGCYPTQKHAEAVARKIRHDSYEGYAPWKGYFERLEEVYIETMTLEEAKSYIRE